MACRIAGFLFKRGASEISKNCHSISQSEIPYYMNVEKITCGEFGTLISSFRATLYKGQIPYYMRVEINPVQRIWDTYFQFLCDTLQGSDTILHARGNKSHAANLGHLFSVFVRHFTRIRFHTTCAWK